MRLKRYIKNIFGATAYYIGNHFISKLPSYTLRHFYYRRIFNIKLGRDSSIAMGQFFTGRTISIGNNTVINRNCYIDGRYGVDIKNNVNISPEVYILSGEHDPQSERFEPRGGKVIIEDDVWIGVRAIILPSVTLGKGAVIGAGAVVTRDVPPYVVAVGCPAKPIKKRNSSLKYLTRYFPLYDTDISITDKRIW